MSSVSYQTVQGGGAQRELSLVLRLQQLLRLLTAAHDVEGSVEPIDTQPLLLQLAASRVAEEIIDDKAQLTIAEARQVVAHLGQLIGRCGEVVILVAQILGIVGVHQNAATIIAGHVHTGISKHIVDGGKGEVGLLTVVAQVDAVFPEVQRHPGSRCRLVLMAVVLDEAALASLEARLVRSRKTHQTDEIVVGCRLQHVVHHIDRCRSVGRRQQIAGAMVRHRHGGTGQHHAVVGRRRYVRHVGHVVIEPQPHSSSCLAVACHADCPLRVALTRVHRHCLSAVVVFVDYVGTGCEQQQHWCQ